jgi:uncharacterized protein (TIGR02246 family)
MKKTTLSPNIVVVAVLIVAAFVFATGRAEQKPEPKSVPVGAAAEPKAPATDPSPDEKAIRQTREASVKAYNAGDAEALAALYTQDAEIVDEDGTATRGRAAIQKVFTEFFKENAGAKMEITEPSVHLVSPNVAIEDGASTVCDASGEPTEHCRSLVIYIKDGDRWLMGSARDLPGEPPAVEAPLKQLGWLIGEWVDEGEDCLVHSSYRWTEDRKFILNEFAVHIEGEPRMTGTMRIGWDPLRKQIRSWYFDSEGGFGEGAWVRQGDKWILTLAGVTNDGKPGSKTMIMSRLGKDQFSWEAHDCMVSGALQPNLDPVIIVRKPPEAK